MSRKCVHEMVKQFKAYGKADTGSSSNINNCVSAIRILWVRKNGVEKSTIDNLWQILN